MLCNSTRYNILYLHATVFCSNCFQMPECICPDHASTSAATSVSLGASKSARKRKWSWVGYINRLEDDRWTSRVTTWRLYDKKRRQGRSAKWWSDDLVTYGNDTIWQRTAQDRLTWRRHAEAFTQPQDTTAA